MLVGGGFILLDDHAQQFAQLSVFERDAAFGVGIGLKPDLFEAILVEGFGLFKVPFAIALEVVDKGADGVFQIGGKGSHAPNLIDGADPEDVEKEFSVLVFCLIDDFRAVFEEQDVDGVFPVAMAVVLKVLFAEIVEVIQAGRKKELGACEVEKDAEKADEEKGAEDLFAGQAGGLQCDEFAAGIHRKEDLQRRDEKRQGDQQVGALDELKNVVGRDMRDLDPLVDNEILHMQGVIDEGIEEKEAAQKEEENFEKLKEQIPFPDCFDDHSTPWRIDFRERSEMRMISG